MDRLDRFDGRWVCFPCRKMFRKPGALHQVCPQCRAEMTDMGRYFEAPRQADRRLWEALQGLAASGYRFRSEGAWSLFYGPGSERRRPTSRTVRQRVRAWLERGGYSPFTSPPSTAIDSPVM